MTRIASSPLTVPSDAPASVGRLIVVPTPIGNPADISLRALDVLRNADLIAAEDPRVTRLLLGEHAIQTAIQPCADKAEQVEAILTVLAAGRSVALVCDVGTPAIADPGAHLISAAIHGGHQVTALPGPVAAIVALVASGLATQRFAFDGFPPRGRADREAFFASLAGERRTVILYESARYLRSTLTSLQRRLPTNRQIAIASNLTTPRETIWRGSLSAAVEWVQTRAARGSYTLVIGTIVIAPTADT